MAQPLRTQIRNRAITALTNLPTTGANVYAGRWHPVKDDKLPALFVRLTTEQRINDEYPRPRAQEIAPRLVVVASAKGTDAMSVDEILDQINLEVRHALADPAVFAGVAKRCDYEGIDEEGEDVDNLDTEAMSSVFTVPYITRENAVDVPL